MVEIAALLPLHLGGLHTYEKVLTLVLAFGPFLLLAVVAVVRRRQGIAEEERESALTPPATERRPDPGA